jgi:hypothetical protein
MRNPPQIDKYRAVAGDFLPSARLEITMNIYCAIVIATGLGSFTVTERLPLTTD